MDYLVTVMILAIALFSYSMVILYNAILNCFVRQETLVIFGFGGETYFLLKDLLPRETLKRKIQYLCFGPYLYAMIFLSKEERAFCFQPSKYYYGKKAVIYGLLQIGVVVVMNSFWILLLLAYFFD